MFGEMFEGFDKLLNDLTKDASEKHMKFREQSNYRKQFDIFGETIRAYREAKESNKDTTEGLEDLMLEAYRFMKFIRDNNNVQLSSARGPYAIDEALNEVMSILDEPAYFCVPMFREADALETLSYSIFKVLKDKGDIKTRSVKLPSKPIGITMTDAFALSTKVLQPSKESNCEYCNTGDGLCIKHGFVKGMIFCNGCHGFITGICEHHSESM